VTATAVFFGVVAVELVKGAEVRVAVDGLADELALVDFAGNGAGGGRGRGRVGGRVRGRVSGRLRGRVRGRVHGRLRGGVSGRLRGRVGSRGFGDGDAVVADVRLGAATHAPVAILAGTSPAVAAIHDADTFGGVAAVGAVVTRVSGREGSREGSRVRGRASMGVASVVGSVVEGPLAAVGTAIAIVLAPPLLVAAAAVGTAAAVPVVVVMGAVTVGVVAVGPVAVRTVAVRTVAVLGLNGFVEVGLGGRFFTTGLAHHHVDVIVKELFVSGVGRGGEEGKRKLHLKM